MMNLVRDMLGLLAALDRPYVAGVVGHDFGSSVAAWCALVRPDIFRSVTMMSAPFAGPPGLAATDEPRHPSRAGGTGPPAEALPVVLLDA